LLNASKKTCIPLHTPATTNKKRHASKKSMVPVLDRIPSAVRTCDAGENGPEQHSIHQEANQRLRHHRDQPPPTAIVKLIWDPVPSVLQARARPEEVDENTSMRRRRPKCLPIFGSLSSKCRL
jgi:hypothetical protein